MPRPASTPSAPHLGWTRQSHYRHGHGENIQLDIRHWNHNIQDFDVDDVGALCAAHGLVQLGEAEILAVGD